MANEEIREYELGRKDYRNVKRFLERLCSNKQAIRFAELSSNHYYINKEIYGEVIVASLDSGTGLLRILGDSLVLGKMYSVMTTGLELRLNTKKVRKLNV